ncbi:MAG: FAD-binding protein [Proteobacteria bacterium]|nr:FAD-binding protein [Pseudomonadota bacterium]
MLGEEGLLTGEAALRVYECDGYTLEKARPALVLLPATTQEVSRSVELLHEAGIAFVPRGAGTGVSGGCLPADIPVMIGTSRMRRIRHVDLDNRRVEVEAGVVNLDVTRLVQSDGLHYAPDPSSQAACTIGGNVAENSGGPHTLKYGVTVNHLLGLELVLPDGEVLQLSREAGSGGFDLAGLVTGSEGTLGIITSATLALVKNPQAVATVLAVFPAVLEASRAVSAIIAAGLVPAALEMMDALVIEAVEAAYGFGFPADAGAVLIIELDGLAAALDEQCVQVTKACSEQGASEIRRADDPRERELLWKSRKRAFGAMGRLAPSYCTQDGVVPRSALPEIVERVGEIGRRYKLRIANLMHAGDGNIHPLLLYDENDPAQVARVLDAGRDILLACLELGGSVTGEHGIGIEKTGLMPASFGPATLAAMADLREVFNPRSLCNPHKILPSDRHCVEVTRPRPRGGG